MVSAFALPIKLIDKNNHAIEDIPISQEDYKNCIRRSVIIPTAIHEDSRHDIWIGTVSNGLLRYSSANKNWSLYRAQHAPTYRLLRRMNREISG